MKENESITVSSEALRDVMIRRIREAVASCGQSGPPRLSRIVVSAAPLNSLQWLARSPNPVKIHFAGRDLQDPEISGVGAAAHLFFPSAINHADIFRIMQTDLSPDFPHMRYYGGFAFSPGHVDADWLSFGMCRFIIPRFEIRRSREQTVFACHLPIPLSPRQAEEIIGELTAQDFQGHNPLTFSSKIAARTDIPGYSVWISNLESILRDISSGSYKKTVIARKVLLELDTAPQATALLRHLKTLPPPRYNFLFQFDGQTAFLGSSPERLYKRLGRDIASEAVAGTRSRSDLEQEDNALAQELLNSRKEQREHDFVADTIESQLAPLCSLLNVEREKSLLRLREGQHLISRMTGVLKPGVTDAQLVEILHPTPAVCGCPPEKALEAIQRAEPFKRGWYAGIIGAVGADDADFAVGLRSASLSGNRLALYSGVGIVEGSIPRQEWAEVDYKIQNFLHLLNKT